MRYNVIGRVIDKEGKNAKYILNSGGIKSNSVTEDELKEGIASGEYEIDSIEIKENGEVVWHRQTDK